MMDPANADSGDGANRISMEVDKDLRLTKRRGRNENLISLWLIALRYFVFWLIGLLLF